MRQSVSNQPVSRWMTSLGILFARSLAATARVSSSEKYEMRLIQRPKDHKGGMGALPVSFVYSSRTSRGLPRNTNTSSSSSPRRSALLPW